MRVIPAEMVLSQNRFRADGADKMHIEDEEDIQSEDGPGEDDYRNNNVDMLDTGGNSTVESLIPTSLKRGPGEMLGMFLTWI